MAFVRIALFAALCALLSACGGGGGGGDDGGGRNAFTITLDRSAVSFEYMTGAQPPQQIVTARWSGQPPSSLFIGAQMEGDALEPFIPVTITETQATFPLRPRTGLAAGNYSGRVLMLACTDQACNQRVGGTPIPISYTVNVRPPILISGALVPLRRVIGAPTSATGTIAVAATTGAWTAAGDRPWLTLSTTSGTGAAAITVGANTAGLAVGRHDGFVTVTSGTLSQRVWVALEIVAPFISLQSSSGGGGVYFSGVNGAPIAAESVNVVLSDNAQVDAFTVTSNQPWLVIDSASSAPAFSAHVDPSIGPLASGSHQAQLTLTFTSGSHSYAIIYPATLQLQLPTLSLSAPALTLGGPAGREFDQTPITVGLNTGAYAHNWSVSGAQSWMQLDRTSGSTGASGQTVLFTPVRAGLPVGSRGATLIFTATVNGDTVSQSLPATLNIDTHKLLVSETGVGFTSAPGMQRLTRTLQVRSNYGEDEPWMASDDAGWLDITASGGNGDDLVLTADPTGLTADQLYTATVTITPDDSSIEPDRVRVGLWVGSAAPAARTSISDVFTEVEADPIRPYVYAHGGGASVRVFNVHTGTELEAFANVAPALGAMTVSKDGDVLFVRDTTNERVVPIDLRTGVVGSPWTIAANPLPGYATTLHYARPNGVGLVLITNGRAYRASSGEDLGQSPFGYLDVTADGKHVFSAGSRYDIDYTDATTPRYSFGIAGYAPIDAQNHKDTATSVDGSRVYSASGYPYNFPRYNGLTFVTQGALPGTYYPNNVELGSDGRVHCASDIGGSEDVWIYDADGFLVDSFRASLSSYVRDRTLQVSADGFISILAVGGNSNELVFRVVN